MIDNVTGWPPQMCVHLVSLVVKPTRVAGFHGKTQHSINNKHNIYLLKYIYVYTFIYVITMIK